MTNKFKNDLKNGKEYEKKALLHIQQKYPKAYIIDGYCLDWDIYIPELKIGVEVKSDAQYKLTGNFYVEYSCNGKPSGIATTKADIYYVYLDKLYIIKTKDLKDKCRKYINTNRDKKGGDYMASKGIILPINELL
tara:strand:+ start:246 stop:650 length:405 start_codon:yes stop_codon:yes gene_type:complete